MDDRQRMRVGVWLLTAVVVVHIIAYLVAQTEHVVDPHWPDHARFHTLQALIWIVGLDALLVALILGPLRKMKRWTLPLLLIGGVTSQGAYFATMLLFPAGRPPELSAHLIMAVLAAGFAVGTALVWGPVQSADNNTEKPG